MGILGVGLTKAFKLQGTPTVYVEYHLCDKCGTEFRLYYRSPNDLEEVRSELRNKIDNNGKEDLCFSCQDPLPSEQLLLPIPAG